MIRRVALAILFVPVLLVGISLLGLLFGAIGTVIHLVLRDQTEIRTLGFRILIFVSIVFVSLVGIVRILNWFLGFAHRLGQRSPGVRRVASDSMLVVVAFGGLVGIVFLAFGAFGVFPTRRVPLLICGAILSLAASVILLPRLYRAKNEPKRPDGRPPSGALGAGIPRAPESTTAQASRVASGGAV